MLLQLIARSARLDVSEHVAVKKSECEMALQGTYSRRAIDTVMPDVLLSWQMSSRLPRMTAVNSLEFEFVKRSSTQSMRSAIYSRHMTGFEAFENAIPQLIMPVVGSS